MHTAALFAVALSSAHSYRLATLTRVYYPVGDQRISHFAICLVSFDGHIHRLTKSKSLESCLRGGPVWKDRDQVEWVEHHGKLDELWQASLPTLRVRRVKVAKEIRLNEANESEKRLRLVRTNKDVQVRWNNGTYRLVNPQTKWLLSSTSDGKSPFGIDEIGDESFGAESQRVGKYEIVAGNFPFTAHDVAWLLLRLDPSTKEARLLPIDAADIRLGGRSNQFVAISGRRVDPHGDVGLWTSDIYMGSLPSGTHRRIPVPFSFTIGIATRPAK